MIGSVKMGTPLDKCLAAMEMAGINFDIGQYVKDRDPIAIKKAKNRRRGIAKTLLSLGRAPLKGVEPTQMISDIFIAAIEAYRNDDMEPIRDMIGGWEATIDAHGINMQSS